MKFYLDEDISPKVAELLRRQGIDAVSAHETGMLGAPDENQLLFATNDGRALVTRNRDDFILLTARFFEGLKPHHGLVIVPHTLPGGDFARLASSLKILAGKHPQGLESYSVMFLSAGSGGPE